MDADRRVLWAEKQRKAGKCIRCAKKRSSRSKWVCDECLDKQMLRKKLKQMEKLEMETEALKPKRTTSRKRSA